MGGGEASPLKTNSPYWEMSVDLTDEEVAAESLRLTKRGRAVLNLASPYRIVKGLAAFRWKRGGKRHWGHDKRKEESASRVDMVLIEYPSGLVRFACGSDRIAEKLEAGIDTTSVAVVLPVR